MRTKSLLCIVFLLMVTEISVAQIISAEEAARLHEQITDPEAERLTPGYINKLPKDPKNVSFSRKMEGFLSYFTHKYSGLFIESDIEKIIAHKESWFWDDYLVVMNASRAYTYEVLHKYDQMSYEELVEGGIYDYVDAYEHIEADMERRQVEHHMILLDSLSEQGSSDVIAIMDGEIAKEIADSSSSSKFDMRGFTNDHPEAMARQLLKEATIRTGPPEELVMREIRHGNLVIFGAGPKPKEEE